MNILHQRWLFNTPQMVVSYTPIVFYTHYHEPTPQFIRTFTPQVDTYTLVLTVLQIYLLI